MNKKYKLICAKVIDKNFVNKFNKISLFLKYYFKCELKTKINDTNNYEEENNIENIENNDEKNNLDKINKQLEKYNIPSDIKTGLSIQLNEIEIGLNLINNKFIENLNNILINNSHNIIIVITLDEYNKLIEIMNNMENSNILKLPKIENNRILGLNDILTFDINEYFFNNNKQNVIKTLINFINNKNLVN